MARHLVTIRHFFRFALIEGFIKEDPAATIESPKFRQSLPEFLSVEEVERLLAQPDTTSPVGLRDKAMIELMYSTGMRVSELCGHSGWRFAARSQDVFAASAKATRNVWFPWGRKRSQSVEDI